MPCFIALSPHFPHNFRLFWPRLQAAGIAVLGVADEPWDALGTALQQSLTDYWRVDNMQDLDALTFACQELQARHGPVQWIESHNEHWLETEAELRARLGIAGPQPEQLAARKRKSGMQEAYRAAGIPVAAGGLVTSWERCQQWRDALGYPLVAKPDIGVGAAQTYKISSDAELEAFWQHKPDQDYFLQAFVSGDLYSFDGLVDRSGQIVFCASHRFSRGIMEIVNQHLDLSYYSLREIPPELQHWGEKTLAAFDVRERFFHFEFFLQPNGQWRALEVNLRPPGGWTLDMMNFSADIDLYQAYAELIAHGAVTDFAPRRIYHVAFAGRKTGPYRLSHDEILARYADALVHHALIDKVFYPVMGAQGYLLRSPDLDALQQMIAAIQEGL
jgi:biotin carboxylase